MSPNASTSRDTQSLQYVVRSGIAGGVAGSVAKTVVAPLDRVKILFQASNPDFQKYAGSWSGAFRAASAIYRNGGIRGLLQGHSATLLRIFPYAGIKFMAYDQVRHVLIRTREQETNIRRFTAGAVSGMISVFFTYPLEIIRVRMAYYTRAGDQPVKASFRGAISKIYHEGSVKPGTPPPQPSLSGLFTRFPLLKFYRGFSVTTVGIIPYAGISFLTWDFLRASLLPRPPSKPTPVADLAIGAVSGALAQTVSYPFEIIRRRMQVGGITQPNRWLRLGETVSVIWNANGWRGFYIGLSIGYLKVVPMTAVSFAVWQGMKRVLGV